jgi:hypothetical protein
VQGTAWQKQGQKKANPKTTEEMPTKSRPKPRHPNKTKEELQLVNETIEE